MVALMSTSEELEAQYQAIIGELQTENQILRAQLQAPEIVFRLTAIALAQAVEHCFKNHGHDQAATLEICLSDYVNAFSSAKAIQPRRVI